jgi:hypothetical protein
MKTVRPNWRCLTCLSLVAAVSLWATTALAQVAPTPTKPPSGVPACVAAEGDDTGIPPAPTPAPSSQPVVTDFGSLRLHLGRGDRVTLVRTDGSAASGKIIRIGASDLDLRAEVGEPGERRRTLTIAIPFETIESLDRRRDSTKNRALTGAGVGAGVDIALFAHA